jgi:uncharacterized protein
MKMLLKEAALQGARDIVAEWINENIYENNCVVCMNVKATITTKVVKTKKDEAAQKFSQYFDWSES